MAKRRRAAAAARKPRKAKASSPRFPKASPYLKKLSTAVRRHFAKAVDLPTFLSSAGQLTAEDRKLIVRQALILLDQNYAHLPLKKAMHSIDPVQRLRLLLQALEMTPPSRQLSEFEFHAEITDIFTSVRDLHTNYLLPAPFNEMTAFLPFMVEDYIDHGKRRYLVSHVADGFRHPTFRPGVEIVYWNGTPIDRAVANNAQRYAGSNPDARHARGVQTLTTRALIIAPPPDEEWVVVGYRTKAGKLADVRLDWQVNPPLPASVDAQITSVRAAAGLGLDLEQEIVQRVRKSLFAPQVVDAEKKAARKAIRGVLAALESGMPNVFEARKVTTPSGTFGYLRVRTFSVFPAENFINEFIRLITALPSRGLILDVRGNGGGVINAGEFALQTLTPRRIEPEPFQFINSPLNLDICRHNGKDSNWTDLSAWVESMQQALQTGAAFSAGFPVSDPEMCNAIGQKYFGPVVLITDGLCYSTTDIFASGFQDHDIGPVLGVAGSTGAGGANVWEQQYFASDILPGSVYQPLPNGAGMRVAIRRTLRVGRRAGAPVEDLGVIPDERHDLTRNDLLKGNVDLINRAGTLLAAKPVRQFAATVHDSSPTQAKLAFETEGMTRLDVYLGERPIQSLDLHGGRAAIVVPKKDGPQATLEVRGFDGTQLVARYRTPI
jgi:C-terminal processing protease CtpA/Prc